MSRMVMRRVGLVLVIWVIALSPMAGFAQQEDYNALPAEEQMVGGDVALNLEVIGINGCDITRMPLRFDVEAVNINTWERHYAVMYPIATNCMGVPNELFRVPAGVYSLQVSAPEFEVASQQIEVAEDGRTVAAISIYHQEKPTVRVSLVAERGYLCASEWVWTTGTLTVVDSNWLMVYSNNSVAAMCGELWVDTVQLPEGTNTARIVVGGYSAGETSFVVEGGDINYVTVRVAP